MVTTAESSLPSWYRAFKTAIFALLICNAALYFFTGTLNEALDTVAWLALLVLFQLETGFGGRQRVGASSAIRAARLVAATAIVAAAIGYVNENEWLDVINTALWIAVVVLLELEVRYPQSVKRRRTWFTAAAVVLYGALAALIPIWAWSGEWFDAYDALLWLTAFALIEMDMLGISRRVAAV